MKKQVMKKNALVKNIELTILIALLVSVVTGIATAETGDVIWYETYNFSEGSDIDQYECYDMEQTPDGGYIFAGMVDYESDSYPSRAMLLKVDENRDTMWVHTYGWDTYSYIGKKVMLTSDGGYVLSGYSSDPNNSCQGHGAFFIKVDANGDTAWTRYYGDEDAIYPVYDAFVTDDGGYAMFGYKYNEDEWGFGIKADADGNEVWVHEYDSPNTSHCYCLVLAAEQTDDGGFILAGDSKYYSEDYIDLYIHGMIMKVDANGDVEWGNVCDSVDTEFDDIHVTSDGDYLIGGRYWGRDNNSAVCFAVMKYNSSGEEVFFSYTDWENEEDYYIYGYCFAARELPDSGGYVAVGNQQYCSFPSSDEPDLMARNYNPVLMNINSDGSFTHRVYTEEFEDLYCQWGTLAIEIWDVYFTPEGNYLICGFWASQLWDNIYGYWNEDDRSKVFIAELEGVTVSVDDNNTTILAQQVSLLQNYPNPFNATTSIQFSLNKSDNVTLSVYDILGRKVNILYSGSLSAGTHSITWNGADESGNVVSSGVYFYRLETSDNVSTKQMLLLK